jgi:hypothetical protein
VGAADEPRRSRAHGQRDRSSQRAAGRTLLNDAAAPAATAADNDDDGDEVLVRSMESTDAVGILGAKVGALPSELLLLNGRKRPIASNRLLNEKLWKAVEGDALDNFLGRPLGELSVRTFQMLVYIGEISTRMGRFFASILWKSFFPSHHESWHH